MGRTSLESRLRMRCGPVCHSGGIPVLSWMMLPSFIAKTHSTSSQEGSRVMKQNQRSRRAEQHTTLNTYPSGSDRGWSAESVSCEPQDGLPAQRLNRLA